MLFQVSLQVKITWRFETATGTFVSVSTVHITEVPLQALLGVGGIVTFFTFEFLLCLVNPLVDVKMRTKPEQLSANWALVLPVKVADLVQQVVVQPLERKLPEDFS